MTFEDIVEANAGLQTLPVKGKEYVMVKERVKAFRRLCPEGTITTELVKFDRDYCVMTASVYKDGLLLARATAMEECGSSTVNKTSYVENCETSAVGRALGFLGLGIDVGIASAEEMVSVVARSPIDARSLKTLRQKCQNSGVSEEKLAALYKVPMIENFTEAMLQNAIEHWEKVEERCEI